MLSLHVFLVDTGTMLTFDMEMALESVSRLMAAIAKATHIAVEKQVLLISTGEPLNPASRVASYPNVGTEPNPIYLFSKSTIESNIPPSPSVNFGSELLLKEDVERSLKMAPTYETVVSRDKLAAEFHRQAMEFTQTSNDLVNAQKLQEMGWAAVVANLESIVRPFLSHLERLRTTYNDFVMARPQYESMLNGFEDVVSLLRRIPILPCLSKSTFKVAPPESLLGWISVQDKRFSVMSLVEHCSSLVKNFNDSNLSNVLLEMDKVEAQISEGSNGMREIKGLSERLKSLEERLALMGKLLQDQEVMAQGFHQNRLRAQHLGDTSVLPDLCASHQKQLVVLLKNHQKIREIYKVCVGSQDELSANLHKRLRWIMYIEKLICESDNKALIYFENLQRIKKRLEVIEQVYEAPRMYVLAMLEVLRRKNFSSQFLEWGRNVSGSANSTRNQELEHRSNFSNVFGNHFLQSLFPGLDDLPKPFADDPPLAFDSRLPDVTVDDLKLLQANVPELLTELSLGDCFDQSIYTQERLSQSNLSKLVDPKQNPTLEETLEFRKKTNVDVDAKLTVSQLQREMSCDKVDVDLSERLIPWQIGSDSADSPAEEDFRPSSLGALPERSIRHMASSSSSSESDSMFKSANAGSESETLAHFTDKDATFATSSVIDEVSSSLQSDRKLDVVMDLQADEELSVRSVTQQTDEVESSSSQNRTVIDSIMAHLHECKDASVSCSSDIVLLRQYVTDYCSQCQNHLNTLQSTAGATSAELTALREKNSLLEQQLLTANELREADANAQASSYDGPLRTEACYASHDDCNQQISELSNSNHDLEQKIKELEADIEKKAIEIAKLNTAKLQLESDQQGRFNAALSKIKKDKEASVKLLTAQNQQLQMQLDNLEASKAETQDKEEKLKTEVIDLQSKLDLLSECHQSETDRLKQLIDELEKSDRLTDVSIEESVELVPQRESHAVGPKSSTSSQLSVEEAVDALEWERVQERLKALENENRQLKDLHNVSDDSLKNQLVHARLLLRDKEEQCKSLHQQLAERHLSMQSVLQSNQLSENISIRSPDKQEIVALLYDPAVKSCLVFCLDDMKHFIHPESMALLPFKADLESGKLKCFLARIEDKEYCFTKKPHNHLKLPVGTYFCRVKVSPMTW